MTLTTSTETPSQTPSRFSKVKEMADKTARMEKLNAAVKELAEKFGYQEALVEFKPFFINPGSVICTGTVLSVAMPSI